MKDKGIEELLEAARRIHEKHPETVFELLGAYEEETRARYEPMIEDLQSKGIVRYYGYRDDMPEFYRHCQAVIHPSYHEGMSNVLQEAAATARPVIASDINGCREIFEKLRDRGILIRHFNAPRISGYLRITIGTPDQMQRFLTALDEILEG